MSRNQQQEALCGWRTVHRAAGEGIVWSTWLSLEGPCCLAMEVPWGEGGRGGAGGQREKGGLQMPSPMHRTLKQGGMAPTGRHGVLGQMTAPAFKLHRTLGPNLVWEEASCPRRRAGGAHILQWARVQGLPSLRMEGHRGHMEACTGIRVKWPQPKGTRSQWMPVEAGRHFPKSPKREPGASTAQCQPPNLQLGRTSQ